MTMSGKSKFPEGDFNASKKLKTEAFSRNFAHVDGNWPSHVYLTGNYNLLQPLFELCLNHLISRPAYSDIDFITIPQPHLSLSKPFVLRHHQIESFVRQLGQCLAVATRFSVQVFSEYQLLQNESSTRLFVTLPVEDHDLQLKKLIHSVDSILKLFSQQIYYDKPLHHISIASCVISGDASHSQRVVQVSETFKQSRRFFSIFNDSDSDDEDSREVNKSVVEGNEFDLSDSLMSNSDKHEEDESESQSAAEDCLGVVMEFTGLECRIGSRLFRFSFPATVKGNETCTNSALGFKEIK